MPADVACELRKRPDLPHPGREIREISSIYYHIVTVG